MHISVKHLLELTFLISSRKSATKINILPIWSFHNNKVIYLHFINYFFFGFMNYDEVEEKLNVKAFDLTY